MLSNGKHTSFSGDMDKVKKPKKTTKKETTQGKKEKGK